MLDDVVDRVFKFVFRGRSKDDFVFYFSLVFFYFEYFVIGDSVVLTSDFSRIFFMDALWRFM